MRGRRMVEFKEFEGVEKKELAMVNVAKVILNHKRQVMAFSELLSEIADYLTLSDDELDTQMAQFYTDLNIDGRFISLGDNRWGLREWYPVDSIDEELTHDNDLEDITPKRAPDGFDDIDDIDDLDELDDEDELSDDGDEVDEVSDDDVETYDDYQEDLEDLGNDEELEDLTIVDDEILESE